MSRVGKQPIPIPSGVDVKIEGPKVMVKGPKGQLNQEFSPLVKLELTKDQIKVSVANPQNKKQRSLWGLTQRLISNLIKGVTEGYEKQLELRGVGYKARVEGKKLILAVGFSHTVEFNIPEGIETKVEKNIITLSGIDKQLVGEIAAQIRRIRKPEPYKGKGIRYVGEEVRQKVGKKMAVTAE
jgi:large subunit ribosomal protein L6